jgi:hypothetical protein
VLVDEHERRDELALRVQEMNLGRGRDHVREQVPDPRSQLVDGFDQSLAITAHFFFS